MAEIFSQEWYDDNKENLARMGDALEKYLAEDKTFCINPERYPYVIAAYEAAKEICTDCTISIKHGASETGDLVLEIVGWSISATDHNIKTFYDIFKGSSIFEIYALPDEKIQFDIVFDKALIKL